MTKDVNVLESLHLPPLIHNKYLKPGIKQKTYYYFNCWRGIEVWLD